MIDYKNLKIYLESLEYNDFHNGKIEQGHSIIDIETFNVDKTKIKLSSVIFYNEPFLVDAIGNDLSIVYLKKRLYRLPTGRTAKCKFDKTIISDCIKQYGGCLNGYWKIPEKFIKK